MLQKELSFVEEMRGGDLRDGKLTKLSRSVQQQLNPPFRSSVRQKYDPAYLLFWHRPPRPVMLITFKMWRVACTIFVLHL
jgi:hypothetical protein